MRAVYHRQHWIVKALLWLTLAWVLSQAILLTANVESSNAATNPDADLANATVIETTGLSLASTFQPAQTLAAIAAGCHGRVWRQLTIKIPVTGIVIGWRRTAVDTWCWNSKGVIYDDGKATGDDGKYAAFPYCWYDTTFGKVWWTVSRTEVKVWNQGTMRTCGKVSLGTTLNPRIYFHGATTARAFGYWNFGGTVIYPR